MLAGVVILGSAQAQSNYTPTLVRQPFVFNSAGASGTQFGSGMFQVNTANNRLDLVYLSQLKRFEAKDKGGSFVDPFLNIRLGAKVASGFASLFNGENLSPETSVTLSFGQRSTIIRRDAEQKLVSAELQLLTFDIGGSTASYTLANPLQGGGYQKLSRSFNGFSAQANYSRTFSSRFVNASIGFNKTNNASDLKKIQLIESIFASGNLVGQQESAALLGNYQTENQIPITLELGEYFNFGKASKEGVNTLPGEQSGGQKQSQIATSLFVTYNAGQGKRDPIPGAAIYFLTPGAPGVPLFGGTVTYDKGRATAGIFLGFKF